jgi:hypothetical protein
MLDEHLREPGDLAELAFQRSYSPNTVHAGGHAQKADRVA